MYFIRTINLQTISTLSLLVRFLKGPRKGSDTTKPGCDRALPSWKILSHNTVVWTGEVNLDYKIAPVLMLWAMIRTKL